MCLCPEGHVSRGSGRFEPTAFDPKCSFVVHDHWFVECVELAIGSRFLVTMDFIESAAFEYARTTRGENFTQAILIRRDDI